jgi:hypothetical protein
MTGEPRRFGETTGQLMWSRSTPLTGQLSVC